MTYSNPKKVLVQIGHKQAKLKKWEKYNKPRDRKQGEVTKRCRRCGRTGSHISKYGMHLCRQCFREVATKIGFKKYN